MNCVTDKILNEWLWFCDPWPRKPVVPPQVQIKVTFCPPLHHIFIILAPILNLFEPIKPLIWEYKMTALGVQNSRLYHLIIIIICNFRKPGGLCLIKLEFKCPEACWLMCAALGFLCKTSRLVVFKLKNCLAGFYSSRVQHYQPLLVETCSIETDINFVFFWVYHTFPSSYVPTLYFVLLKVWICSPHQWRKSMSAFFHLLNPFVLL